MRPLPRLSLPPEGNSGLRSKERKESPGSKSRPPPTLGQRSFVVVRDEGAPTPGARFTRPQHGAAEIPSAINRALHQKGISSVRIREIHESSRLRQLGTTAPTRTFDQLLAYRDTVVKATRSASLKSQTLSPERTGGG